MVDTMVIGYFLQSGWSKQCGHLCFEGTGEESIDVVIAVIGEDKASVLDILMEMGAFLCVELHQFVAADIAEGVMEEIGAFQVDDLFLQIDGQGGIFYQ